MKLPHPVKKARLELASMLDVIFIVLVFLVYAMLGMTVSKGREINLPVSATASIIHSEGISLAVFANGEIALENRKMPLDDLGKELALMRDSLAEPAEILVRVYAEPQLEYQTLYHVLDVLKLAGFARVSLQSR